MRMIDIGSYFRLSLLGSTGILTHLDIVCDEKAKYGLWYIFKDEEKIKDYIKNQTVEAYRDAIHKMHDNYYVLNCQAHDPMFSSEERWLEDQKDMILTFIPIIQKFMVDVLTDNTH